MLFTLAMASFLRKPISHKFAQMHRIKFIGPSVVAINSMGDKASARESMRAKRACL
jgi:biotin carboxylase